MEKLQSWRIYVFVYLSAVLYELAYASYVYAVSHKLLMLAMLSGSALPFLSFVGALFLIEGKNLRTRLLITACTAAGFSSGSLLLFMLM